jgi:hypothetical protein
MNDDWRLQIDLKYVVVSANDEDIANLLADRIRN